MDGIKEIATSINNVYKSAFDEGHKIGYKTGFIDGQIAGLKKAEEIFLPKKEKKD